MRAAQRVLGSRMRPSEPGLRTTGLHKLDRQSQLSQQGCHSRELQDQPLTFCRWFGTANIISTVFSTHSISFLLRETEPEWKSALKYWGTTLCLCEPRAVYAASERHYPAVGGDVQVPKGGIYMWWKPEHQEVDTRIGKAKADLRELYRSVHKTAASKHRKAVTFQINVCSDPYLWLCS